MTSRRYLAIILMGMIATAAPAQKAPKPGNGAALAPQIAYTYVSGSHSELRLANQDGSNATTLHRGASGSIVFLDLGPKAARRIAFIEDFDLKLLTYEITASNTLRTVSVETIYTGPGLVDRVSFSLDGSQIAFAVSQGGSGAVWLYDVASGQVSEWTSIPVVTNLAWYYDGSGVVYSSYDGSYSVHELLLDGSSRILLSEANLEHVDTARTSKDLLVSYSRQDEIRVGLWRNGGYVNERVVAGLMAHFNCDDTRIIYRGFARIKRPTYIYSFVNNTNSTFSTDSNIRHTDWMPTC